MTKTLLIAGVVILVIAAFLVGLLNSGPTSAPTTAGEQPTPPYAPPPFYPFPPSPTPPPTPDPTAVAAAAAATAATTFIPVEITGPDCPFRYRCFTTEYGTIIDSRDFGPHNMGGPLYLMDRDIQLPDDVYLAEQIDKVTCRVPGCGIAPIYELVRGGSKIYIDYAGAAPPGWPNEGDQSVFDFLFEE